MPNVADTPENAAFRRYFYSKWGRENCVISARARSAIYPPYMQRLSIKCAWQGAELYHVDGRTVAVDDDNYLVLNDQREYSSTLLTSTPLHSFTIFFRPGLAEEALGTLFSPLERVLDRGIDGVRRNVEFPEVLRPHDKLVTPALRFIAYHAERGLDEEMWYEQEFGFLLERMLLAHHRAIAAVDRLGAARRSTRREMARRIGLSTDYVHTYYEHPLTTGELANAAHLSKFHFIRLFRAVHGITPYQYVQRKRTTVARRLLESTKLPHAQIAARVGFDHRSTLFRQLVRWMGTSGRALRARSPRDGRVPLQ